MDALLTEPGGGAFPLIEPVCSESAQWHAVEMPERSHDGAGTGVEATSYRIISEVTAA